ncbi:Two-component system response regulator protein [hydrothermal vent metagenome]|uniref:Two-component system response regulator protein n=1 Tax=hydrothermal vent metagenome TaxID=652676 RepID=A0A3B1DN67_9ZZZZ
MKTDITSTSIDGMIGDSSLMQEVYALTGLAALSSATILLTGETGTGKELVARALHELSPRASAPFIRVNCGALSDSLLESELFGHVKGAFTNAFENRTGRFEAAHGGTIFLDEINSVSYQLQVKLLRVLQENEFERVGDTKTIEVDCRIIAATNRDLLDEIEAERFREDLYYRLNVIPIFLPPLRERPEDIVPLVEHFVEMYALQNNLSTPRVDAKVYSFLKNYTWPGNVRELQNYIERAIVLSRQKTFTSELLPSHVRGLAPVRIGSGRIGNKNDLCSELVHQQMAEAIQKGLPVHEYVMSLVEKELIVKGLKMCQGVQTKTATKLGINRNTLHKKIEEYHLDDETR